MGRFLVIVVLLVGAALLTNHFIKDEVEEDTTSAVETSQLPAIEPKETSSDTGGEMDANSGGEEEADKPSGPAAEDVGEEEVQLGTPELTSGIPGTGPLSTAEIENWLADARNHMVLKPILPKGLSAGANQIQGIDENPLTRAKIELGRQLYFDRRLSSDMSISCASCHDPANGYAKDTKFGIGVNDQMGGRNSPVAYNRILSGKQFWDGRAATLEDQAIGPIENPIEMGNTHEACAESLGGIEGYRIQFEKIFRDGVTIENVGKAIASFERVIVTGTSPWDYYAELRDFEKAYADDLEDEEALKEDDPQLFEDYEKLEAASAAHPIDESAIRGGEAFFTDKTGCTACHVGANFTDELYHNLGVGMSAEDPDLGRFAETNEEKDKGAFKTPTVRNVALTAPYMHDGSVATLEDVVELYAKGGEPNPHLSEKVKKLELTDQDKADLVAFMKALSGDFPPVETARLPE